MADIKLHEQLVLLRRQKGLTQEELAKIFGVTNQSVSKWESGACCPDISLLPDIADFFGVSVDALFSRSPANSLEDTVQTVKHLFADTPDEMRFDYAYKLAVHLHWSVCSEGHKANMGWDGNRNRNPKTDGDYYKWGFSVCSEPEGATVMKGNTVMFAAQRHLREADPNDLMAMATEMEKYADIDRLIVFFALYDLTRKDFDLFPGIREIAEKAKMSEEKVREAFKWLPIHHKRLNDGSFGYRIEGHNMHIPALLLLFLQY